MTAYTVPQIANDIVSMLSEKNAKSPEDALRIWQIENNYKIPTDDYDAIVQIIEW